MSESTFAIAMIICGIIVGVFLWDIETNEKFEDCETIGKTRHHGTIYECRKVEEHK